MQLKARQIHIFRSCGRIKPGQYVAELFCMFRKHTTRVVAVVQALQALVTKRLNHDSL